VWGPVYLSYTGFCKLKDLRKHDPHVKVEELAPQTWSPASELERRVVAAMILAGRPVTNAELARLMGCSPGECSKRVKELEGRVEKIRVGREVRLSLPNYAVH
jgi:hypothetical protein